MKTEIKKLAGSQIEILCELEAEKFNDYWQKTLKGLSEKAKVDGFRPGNVPENILIKQVGEETVLYETAEAAIKDIYPKIIAEQKIAAIGQPAVTITKIAKNNPFCFKIITSVLPEFDLPDYQKIAKEQKEKRKDREIKVEDGEVDKIISEIRKSRAPKTDNGKNDEKTKTDDELPPLNDDFAKTLGNFQTVADLKTKIAENIKEEKTGRAKQELRMNILDAIAQKTEMDVPEVLVEAETERLLGETKGQLQQFGIKFEDYLKTAQKTEEQIRKESKEAARKRAKLNLILKQIAAKEKIEARPEEIDPEVQKILDRHKDANPNSAKLYIEDIIINEKVFNLLEE